ncbi:MAG: tRNA preQ1(34) S-adenosylmethionine ribosyltransferase-isomerase QueA [Candidatus Moranbacteria bacterium]|nr:tRNA preQ1(34) S-adenosylmethionine ribosyltransferase-isomerase QueA [Candidatus Moranbacteria bacterium]
MQIIDREKYDYTLPEALIRKEGVEPRDSARLFVYDTTTDTVTFDIFKNLTRYLPAQSLMVLNNTVVLPARLWLRKETGGKIEVFVLANEREDPQRIPALVDRKIAIGQKLFFSDGSFFEVIGQNEKIFFLRLESVFSLETLLEQYGKTPLPHYLLGASMEEEKLRKRYQTIFAEKGASVAAPTASLHFTDRVFSSLKKKNIVTKNITLDVGLGTFAPLQDEHFLTGKLHTEFVNIPKETIQALCHAKKTKQPIIAVGTTVTRTLESFVSKSYYFRDRENSKTKKWRDEMCGNSVTYSGKTDIFIYPPYQFQMVDHLLTNFHLPKTSLMLLVDAFLQNKNAKRGIVELYALAIKNNFSFYSFGDSMLIV